MKTRALSLALTLLASTSCVLAQDMNPAAPQAAPQIADKITVPTTPATLVQPRGGLKNVFAKLRANQPVTIAYFGGSITEGAGASREENTYRARTTRWFREQFPQSQITEINAAIGGTGSDLGVFRVGRDVLEKQPDLIFVEFAVNDGGGDPARILRAMEGIVRQSRRALPQCDIAFIYTYVAGFQNEMAQGNLVRAMATDELVAQHYAIPAICVALPIAQRVKAGTMISEPQKDAEGKETPLPAGVELFANDGVHPRDGSMQIYADTITQALPALRNAGDLGPHNLPAPLTSDNWESAKLVALDASMLSPGWKKLSADEGLGKQFSKYLPELWEGHAGDTLKFRFRGTSARLFDIMGPDAGQMRMTVDGIQNKDLISRFDVFCTYHRMNASHLWSGALGTHEVQIDIVPEQPDRSSVTDKEKSKPGFDPKRYDGTAIRIGWLMLLGDLEK
jgi:lysophospholipase L1-like esterase